MFHWLAGARKPEEERKLFKSLAARQQALYFLDGYREGSV